MYRGKEEIHSEIELITVSINWSGTVQQIL